MWNNSINEEVSAFLSVKYLYDTYARKMIGANNINIKQITSDNIEMLYKELVIQNIVNLPALRLEDGQNMLYPLFLNR